MSAVLTAIATSRSPGPPQVRALVVDENAAARSAVKGLLLTLGIEAVQQAADPIRAIRLMEVEAFDLVLCEAQFRSQMDGSQVLEYVRTRRLLAPSAAFVLMGAEAMRSLVAQAREWQPDGFVLKPLTAAALGPRIEQALRRRRLFAPLHEADARGDAEAVLVHARRLSMEAGGASIELLRWQAQALVDLGRFGQAREICEQAIAMRGDIAWPSVALAHCERDEGRLVDAVARLRTTLRLHPSCGEAYDLLIDLLQEQGHVARALAVAKTALEQLSTTQRLRALGEIAFAQGELEQAEECYAELIRRTSSSLTRSPIDSAMLGQVFVSRGASDKALRLVKTVETETDGPSRALAAAVQAQAHSAQGDAAASEEAARRAMTLAGASEPPESVLLLVAHGAFAAGLHDEGRKVAERAVTLRRRAKG
ncbi:MAG: tetratricopeptide repeat protein, partial [Burkholderiales bacterium]